MLDQNLTEKARQGNRWALEQLLNENYHIVYGYLLKLTMDEELAKDITQEVIVKAITHIQKFKGDSKFSTWLVSIASNTYKDSLKKHRVVPTQLDTLNLATTENLEDNVMRKEKIRELKKTLLGLPESQRKVFILKHYYNYSYEEISKILDCPIGTVRSKLHYCILKLKSKIGS